MLPFNKKPDYMGLITLRRSRVLNATSRPCDDVVNWLFLKVGDRQLGFVYKIKNPTEAYYGEPFEIEMRFIFYEMAKEILLLGYDYSVLRGQEEIGMIRLIFKY
jgi:hypothetical protein